jgi:hypothetical protein
VVVTALLPNPSTTGILDTTAAPRLKAPELPSPLKSKLEPVRRTAPSSYPIGTGPPVSWYTFPDLMSSEQLRYAGPNPPTVDTKIRVKRLLVML